jgi:hypothetical protein
MKLLRFSLREGDEVAKMFPYRENEDEKDKFDPAPQYYK